MHGWPHRDQNELLEGKRTAKHCVIELELVANRALQCPFYFFMQRGTYHCHMLGDSARDS